MRIDGALVATTSVRQTANELAALGTAAPSILTCLFRCLVGTDGPTLKKFIEGARWANLMGNIERSIKGPFYFGADPCCCDFFLLQALDWREATFEAMWTTMPSRMTAPIEITWKMGGRPPSEARERCSEVSLASSVSDDSVVMMAA